VVRLDVADGNQRVAALRQRIRRQPFELADLVAAEGKPRGNVVALRPHLDAQFLGQPVQAMQRRRPESKRMTGKAPVELEGHRALPYRLQRAYCRETA
jgi:hypothetical protein